MTDTLALFAGIKRPVRIIALNRPFLQSLPHTSKNLFYVSNNASERMSAVKRAASHLRNGGVVLTFPAGKIEPDPDVYPGALESLNDWTDSAGVFLRLAPGTHIVPVLVRNVLWDKAVKHPLTKLKKTREEREKTGRSLSIAGAHPVRCAPADGENSICASHQRGRDWFDRITRHPRRRFGAHARPVAKFANRRGNLGFGLRKSHTSIAHPCVSLKGLVDGNFSRHFRENPESFIVRRG